MLQEGQWKWRVAIPDFLGRSCRLVNFSLGIANAMFFFLLAVKRKKQRKLPAAPDSLSVRCLNLWCGCRTSRCRFGRLVGGSVLLCFCYLLRASLRAERGNPRLYRAFMHVFELFYGIAALTDLSDSIALLNLK